MGRVSEFLREHSLVKKGKVDAQEAREKTEGEREHKRLIDEASCLGIQMTGQAKRLGAETGSLGDSFRKIDEVFDLPNGDKLEFSSRISDGHLVIDVGADVFREDPEHGKQIVESCYIFSNEPAYTGIITYLTTEEDGSVMSEKVDNQAALDGIRKILEELKTAKPLEPQKSS